MSDSWSRMEDEATVSDYLEMLDLELRGISFVKMDHIRALAALLGTRSEKAIEYKYANISAVLRDLGLPFIDGYKPRSNYQQLLWDVVSSRVGQSMPLLTLIKAQVEAPAVVPTVEDILALLVEPPTSGDETPYPKLKQVKSRGNFHPVNYLEREARNQSLGAAGEELVLRYERARLMKLDRASLAERVERVSSTQGDWLGFDIKSYEATGRDRFIEVKTTRYGKRTPFYLSRNEVNTSVEHQDRYHLSRVFHFHDKPQLFSLAGRLDEVCQLDAVNFLAKVS